MLGTRGLPAATGLLAVWLVTLSAQAPNTGLIVGRVVEATTATPVGQGFVHMYSVDRREPRRSVLTDSNGQFVFAQLPPGRVRLVAQKFGYADGMFGARRAGDYADEPITVAAGEAIGNVTLRIWKFGVITGRVIDEAGEPVIGAVVSAYRRKIRAGRPILESRETAQTDDRGIYRIARLDPGEYIVGIPLQQQSTPQTVLDTINRLQREGQRTQAQPLSMAVISAGAPLSSPGTTSMFRAGDIAEEVVLPVPSGRGSAKLAYRTIYYPNATTLAGATPLLIDSGQERSGIDLRLVPERVFSVTGTLTGARGPGALVGVQLLSADSSGYWWDSQGAAALTVTDTSGRFTFPSVFPGRYTLQVLSGRGMMFGFSAISASSTADGTVLTVGEMTTHEPTNETTLVASMAVDVREDDVRDLAVSLRDGVTISGRVECAGSAAPPTKEQLQRTHVIIESADGRSAGPSLEMTGTIKPDGTFTTVGLPPGRYFVRMPNVPAGWSVESALHNGRDLSDVPVEIGDASIEGVVIRCTDTPGRLTGIVHDGQREADDTNIVIVFPTNPSGWIDYGDTPRRVRSAPVSKGGRYEIKALPPGDYWAVAVRDDFLREWRAPAFLEELTRVATRLRVETPRDQRTLDLTISRVRR